MNELWEYVAKVDPPITLNDQTKHFLWDQITQCTSVISFYLLDNPKPKDQTIFDIQVFTTLSVMNADYFSLFQITYGIGTSTWHIYTPSRPFTPVTDHGDIKGSCASYNARKNITSEIEKFSKEERQLHNILERCSHFYTTQYHIFLHVHSNSSIYLISLINCNLVVLAW